MTGLETRSVSRDSLLLLADIQVEQDEKTHRIRVRNLSNGGMMGEGNLRVKRGNRLSIELRNVGRIAGTVAWVQDDRFGIAFDEEIDAQLARKPQQVAETPDGGGPVERSWRHRAPTTPDSKAYRKV